MRVLVVEDDPSLAALLRKWLTEHAYAVDVVRDGEEALYQAFVATYDVVVLDVTLPGRSGLDVCRELRRRDHRVPVLMLTARDAVADRVAGLDSGADDYLTKPFALAELLARLRALLRRGPELAPGTITVADLVVDTHAQRATRAGRDLGLTTKEYAMLEYLARRAGRVVGRAELSEHVWDENHDPLSNVIEVYIARVRKKVDGVSGPPLISTRRGAGYILAAPGAAPSGPAGGA
ncbi:MAG TPA: response regulator transcription factor [Gemmatirosa sp.]|nr:response regulator transcription factor [Gemmatirosa sp.]